MVSPLTRKSPRPKPISLRRYCSSTSAASYACLDSARLFARLGDPALSGLVRQNAGGRTLLISGLFVPRGERQSDLCQLLITEVLTLALSREFTYALYLPLEGAVSGYGRQLLTLQGFVPAGDSTDALAVDMRCPIVLSRNVDTAVKAPFSSAPRVLAASAAAHRRLQAALTQTHIEGVKTRYSISGSRKQEAAEVLISNFKLA